MAGRDERALNLLRFLVLFNLFSLPLYFFSQLNLPLSPLQKHVAGLTGALLELAGIDTEVRGNLVAIRTPSGMFAGVINSECTGAEMMLGFLALCLATKATVRKKLKSLLFLPLIYCVNALRVFFVFFSVCILGYENFWFIHNVVFGAITVFAILTMWITWMKWIR